MESFINQKIENIVKEMEIYNKLVEKAKKLPIEEFKKLFPLPKGYYTKKFQKAINFLEQFNDNNFFLYFRRDNFFDYIIAKYIENGILAEITILSYDKVNKEIIKYNLDENYYDKEKIQKDIEIINKIYNLAKKINYYRFTCLIKEIL